LYAKKKREGKDFMSKEDKFTWFNLEAVATTFLGLGAACKRAIRPEEMNGDAGKAKRVEISFDYAVAVVIVPHHAAQGAEGVLAIVLHDRIARVEGENLCQAELRIDDIGEHAVLGQGSRADEMQNRHAREDVEAIRPCNHHQRAKAERVFFSFLFFSCNQTEIFAIRLSR